MLVAKICICIFLIMLNDNPCIIESVWQLLLTIGPGPQIAFLGHFIDHWFFVLVIFFNFKIFIPYRPRGYADSLRRVFDPINRIDYFSFFFWKKFPMTQGGSPAVLSVCWCIGFALMIFIFFWKLIPHDPAFGSSNILMIRVSFACTLRDSGCFGK